MDTLRHRDASETGSTTLRCTGDLAAHGRRRAWGACDEEAIVDRLDLLAWRAVGATVRYVLLCCFALACGSSSGAPSAQATKEAGATVPSNSMCHATVTQGAMSGKLTGKTCEYYGIRYAAPPVGTLRFAPPQQAANWNGVLDATKAGNSCIQGASIPGLGATGASGEDCLFVNVFTPQAAATQPLPVMVFIHGGGFSIGSGSPYDSQGLSEDGPTVLVTLNYRLGALGYLALPELDATRPAAPSGSDGIRDQQLALRWVKDNISVFHGDPGNVTVFGESAGSISTCMHVVSPGSQGLARRYILQSLPCIGPGGFVGTKADRYDLSTQLVGAMCPNVLDGGPGALDCLRTTDAAKIMSWVPTTPPAPGSFASLTGNALGAPFYPVVEGAGGVLPDLPANLIKSGQFNKDAAIIAGTTKNEFGLFVYLGMLASSLGVPGPTNVVVKSVAELDQDLQAVFPSHAAQIEQQYPATDATAQQVLIDIVTDYAFRCPTRDFARLTMAHGTSEFYLYTYDYGRAYHSDDLLAVFNVAGLSLIGGTVPTPALASDMKGYWTRFAATGNPNGAGAVPWASYSASAEPYMVLNDPPHADAHLVQAHCDFWDGLSGFTTQ
jgi:para-nitrobenzyl esterase